jgi:hypothetical protein
MYCIWERWEMHKKFQSDNLKEREHLGDTGVDTKKTLKWIFKSGM